MRGITRSSWSLNRRPSGVSLPRTPYWLSICWTSSAARAGAAVTKNERPSSSGSPRERKLFCIDPTLLVLSFSAAAIPTPEALPSPLLAEELVHAALVHDHRLRLDHRADLLAPRLL